MGTRGAAAGSILPEQHVLRELLEELDQAVGLARRAEAKQLGLEQAAEPPPLPSRRKPLPPCANLHGCPDGNLATGDSGRCGTCANYKRNHGGLDRTGRYALVVRS